MSLILYLERRRLWKQRKCTDAPPGSDYLDRRRVYFSQLPCVSGGDMSILGWSDGVVNTGQTRVGMWTAQRDLSLPGSARASAPILGPGVLRKHIIEVVENTLVDIAAMQVNVDGVPGLLITIPAGFTGLRFQDVIGETIAVPGIMRLAQFFITAPAGGGLIRFTSSVEWVPSS